MGSISTAFTQPISDREKSDKMINQSNLDLLIKNDHLIYL